MAGGRLVLVSRRTAGRPPKQKKARKVPYQKLKYQKVHRAGKGLVPYISPNPKTQLVKFRFAINDGVGLSLVSSSGAVADYTFLANDCYDPYYTGAGSQPRNFDQYMAMYRHGIVVKSVIKLQFFFESAPTYSMRAGVLLRDSTTALGAASQADCAESPRSKSVIVSMVQGGPKHVKFVYTPKSFFGSQDVEDNDDLYFTSGASPSEKAAYHVFAHSYGGATQAVFMTGTIEYTAMLLHPILPSQS